MSRSPNSRVDPVLAGMIGAAVVVGGGLLAYGSSQPTDGQAAPAPLVQRDDAVTARALAAVEGLASAGEDGAPSAPDAARRAAQASLRGRSVDPFRGPSGSATATTATGTTPSGTATAVPTPSGTSGTSAVEQARDAAAKAGAAGSAAGGSGGGSAGSGSGGSGGSGSGSPGGSSGGSGSGSTGGSGSGTGGSSTGAGGSGRGGSSAVGGGSEADAAEVARRLAAAERADAARRLQLEADRLAKAPARVSLRVATPNGKRARSRLPVGALLPNRAAAVLRVVRVDRANRIVTLRLRDGARLAGPQSAGTRCVLRVPSTDGCRLVHVRAGKAAVVQAPDVDGVPGPVTAVRVLSVWRGDTRVFGG